MDTLNPRAVIGGNTPPDPIDQITAPFDADREEAANWLDGAVVENEGQMKAVDALRGSMRKWRLALEAGQKSATAPLYDSYKGELARWSPTIDDAKIIEKGLVAAVDSFKRKLADQKAADERQARADAAAAMRAAEVAARAANATDLDAQRAAAEAQQLAADAQRRAAAAAKDTVKGMRTVWRYEITDHKALLNYVAKNDRDAITAFIEGYAAAHHKQQAMDGVRSWSESEAF